MEIKRDMPEEVKNQVVDGKKRVITEKIPEKLYKKIQQAVKRKKEDTQQFLQLSVNIVEAQSKQKQLVASIKGAKESLTDHLNRAFNKMKLAKKKDYHWRLAPDMQSFIGVYNPPKTKKEEGIKGVGVIQPPSPPKNPIRPSDR